MSEHNEQKRLRCSSPADPYCLSEEEEEEVCEEEKPELLLKERESSRPPRLLELVFFSSFKSVKASNFRPFLSKEAELLPAALLLQPPPRRAAL